MNTSKDTYVALLVGVVIAATVIGGYFFPRVSAPVIQQISSASPAGSTFNYMKIAAITVAMTSATSSTVLNTDSNDRIVLSTEIGCEKVGSSNTLNTGTGLASLTVLVGTSSTATPTATALFSPSLEIGNVTLATSSANFIFASSTAVTATSSSASIWASGTYMAFVSNATNTAVCTFAVHYLST